MERIFAKFPSIAAKIDLMQGVAFQDGPRFQKSSFSLPDTMILDVKDRDRARLEALGAILFEDVQFRVLPGRDNEHDDDDYTYSRGLESEPPENPHNFSLDDVLDSVGAPAAWARTRGRGVTIAVVDTGVAAGLREIDAARRSPVDLDTHYVGRHWQDEVGHGSMCAAIAGGSKVANGRYDGAAPEATILAARSTLKASDLFDIYDELLRARAEGRLPGPLVITNSYGLYVCHPPAVMPEDHPFLSGILSAIDQGAFVCFAAGNNHYKQCHHDPTACGPNSIWGPNSHDRVMSIGTVNRNLTNCDPVTPHVDSSRGPGEWAKRFKKPDCVAPTYGEVPWGTTYRKMGWWGTSGACPQVAGLAALLLSIAPALTPDKIARFIRETCSALEEGDTCVGHGVIDFAAAVEAVAASMDDPDRTLLA